jgi:hypothetical protein
MMIAPPNSKFRENLLNNLVSSRTCLLHKIQLRSLQWILKVHCIFSVRDAIQNESEIALVAGQCTIYYTTIIFQNPTKSIVWTV